MRWGSVKVKKQLVQKLHVCVFEGTMYENEIEQWPIRERGPGPRPPTYFYTKTALPPLSKGLDDRAPPPVSQDLDPALSSV